MLINHTVDYKDSSSMDQRRSAPAVPESYCREIEAKKEHGSSAATQSKQLDEMPGTLPHFGAAALLLYGLNQGLAKLTTALGIQFPSALIGMLWCATAITCLHPHFKSLSRIFHDLYLCIRTHVVHDYVDVL